LPGRGNLSRSQKKEGMMVQTFTVVSAFTFEDKYGNIPVLFQFGEDREKTYANNYYQ
jgi:hypothetical protein